MCLLLEIMVLIKREQQKCSAIETPLNGLYCFVLMHAGSISEVCVFQLIQPARDWCVVKAMTNDRLNKSHINSNMPKVLK